MRNRIRGDERGAIAVLAAILALVVLSIAAFAVDLSNGFVRTRDVQAQADFAALAGAEEMSGANTKSAADPAVVAVAEYLNKNQPQDDKGITAVTPGALVDGDETNGEIYFESASRLRVVSPDARVQFELAGVMGHDHVDVKAEATVGIFSPGIAFMPVYAVSGCDQGPQTITDPANGHVTPSGPNLSHAGESNRFSLDTPTATTPNPSPYQVSVNPTTQVVTVRGNNLTAVTKIGLFREGDGVTPAPEPVEITSITHADNNRITFAIPISGVTDHEGLWWVRVFGPASGTQPAQWSSVLNTNGTLNTVPFRVGTPYLRCAGASNQGNYGTLKLPRLDVNNSTGGGWLPTNVAAGLQAPLSLQVYPGDNSSDPLCDPSDGAPTVYSTTTGTPTLLPHTNCVDTDTGLPANSMTAGMITGTNGHAGRLDTPTTDGCDPSGGSDERTVTLVNGSTKAVNDDILTCFFDDPNATVADVSGANYTYNGGAPVISERIFSSPRFFWQPVLGIRPGNGGSDHYKIIDMRPAFLADQPLSATKASPQVGPENGLKIVNGSVSEMSVIFLNVDALKIPQNGPVVDWLGGFLPKVIRLVD